MRAVISRDGKTLNGVCHQLPNAGPLVCLPPPPRPPQEAIDACTGHAAGDACSFTFKDHTVSGACEPMPDGTTLVCRRLPAAPELNLTVVSQDLVVRVAHVR